MNVYLRRTFYALIAVASIWYLLFLARNVGACAGGADSSGYMNQARLIAHRQVHVAQRALPALQSPPMNDYLFVPLGFRPVWGTNDMVPTYAPGLSLLVAAATPLAGWTSAANFVMIGHALAGLALVFFLGRAFGLPAPWALAGVVILAASPLYIEYALQTMSDLPSLVWISAAVLAAWQARRQNSWALAAGFCLALAVLIRANNVIAFLAVAIALGFSWRRWLWLILGGIPGAVMLLLYNRAAYGDPLLTGYGDSRAMFASHFIPPTLIHYAHWLPLLLTPVVAGFLALPWLLRSAPRATWVLLAWGWPFLAFFCAYRHTHETWWFLRFVLPAAPAFVMGGLLVVQRAVDRPALRACAFVLPLLLACLVDNQAYWCRKLFAWSIGEGEETYPQAAAWIQEHVPANRILVCMQLSGGLFYSTDSVIVRWDEVTAEESRRVLAAAAAAKRPVYAALFPWEVDDALQKHLPGPWTKVGTIKQVGIWRRD